MMSKPLAAVFLSFATWGVSTARAQNPGDFQIKAAGNVLRTDGGEQPSVGSSSGPIEIGKKTSTAINKSSRGCGLAVGPRLESDAAEGWSLAFTPARLQGGAVTFRLQWTRIDGGKQSTPTDVELTLRPGESIPIDALPLVRSSTDPPTCNLTGMTLRMSVDYWPPPERETRLIATDLWLVEKAADGSERTQQLTIRGIPNDKLPFFFAPLTDGGVSLDIYGDLRAAPEQDQIVLGLVVRSRLVEGGQSSTIWRNGNFMTSRKIEPTFKAKPGEVVSVELPRLSENPSGAFASKTLSLRVRLQQVR